MAKTINLFITAETLDGMPRAKFPNSKQYLENLLQQQSITADQMAWILAAAVRADLTDHVKVVLEHGADPNHNYLNVSINTLYSLAQKSTDPKFMLDMLEQAGLRADLDLTRKPSISN
jgi:hypothetical protein